MKHALAAVLLLVLAAGSGLAQEGPAPVRAPRPARGQEPRVQVLAPAPNLVYDGNAQETQQRLQELLRQYPPSIGEVLALDPTLLTNQAYLEPYPQLSAFLSQHPEIAHNPSYFLPRFRNGGPRFPDGYNEPRVVALRTVGEALGGLAFLVGFLTVVGTIGWLLRSAIEHRKWLRVSKTHVDTHTRIMERLTSNDDLLAYMQSPAGQRFLNAAPIPVESGPRTLAAPVGRILLSVQAGVVIAFLGGGLIYASARFSGNEIFSEAELPLFVVGATAVAIGVGFFVSAVVAYGLSRRLGLFDRPAAADAVAGTGPTS
jgi:hypothetical protein